MQYFTKSDMLNKFFHKFDLSAGQSVWCGQKLQHRQADLLQTKYYKRDQDVSKLLLINNWDDYLEQLNIH